MEPGGRNFLCGGGDRAMSKIKAVVPVVDNVNTPLHLGRDVLREYGLVLDYHHNIVYRYVLERYIPSKVFSSGHIGIRMLPDPQQH